jgi:hypothetical protein
MCEISASSWFCYKEICYDARSNERKIMKSVNHLQVLAPGFYLQGLFQIKGTQVCRVRRCSTLHTSHASSGRDRFGSHRLRQMSVYILLTKNK